MGCLFVSSGAECCLLFVVRGIIAYLSWLVVCCCTDLLKEYCEWLPVSQHQAVTAIWPPDRQRWWPTSIMWNLSIPWIRWISVLSWSHSRDAYKAFRIRLRLLSQNMTADVWTSLSACISHVPITSVTLLVSIPGCSETVDVATRWYRLLQRLHEAQCA